MLKRRLKQCGMNTGLRHEAHASGFTLVEVAIVVAILGLIAGGILLSQDLIRSAELKSIVTRVDYYTRATSQFKGKYFGLPGDIGNAQNIWGEEAVGNCPGDETTPSTGVATCNGDEDGWIDPTTTPGFGNEIFRFFQHLANADMIDGSFTGVQGPLGERDAVLNENTPELKIKGAGIYLIYLSGAGANSFPSPPANYFLIGRPEDGNGTPQAPFLRPGEVYAIDFKHDDGFPGSGVIRSRNANKHPGCATSDDPLTAVYDAINDNLTCQIVYMTDLK